MKVLAIHSSNDMYGSDRIFLRSVTALHEEGHDVLVWIPADATPGASTLAHEVEAIGLSVRVLDLPVLRRRYLNAQGLARIGRYAWRTSFAIRRNNVDAVYLGTSALAPLAVLARLFTSARVVAHVQELWSGNEGRVLALLSRSAHHCIAISSPVKKAMGPRLAGRTTVVVNAVDDPGPANPPSAPARLTFLVASRWNSWKGHDLLLKAWGTSRPQGAHLLIAGAAPGVGDAFDVVAAVAALDDPSSVTVVGEVGDLRALFDKSDVVVVPSTSPEPFGLVAVEAFAAARPVIASEAGGLAEIVTAGLDGLLFPLGDEQGLARALTTAAESDLHAMGLAARATFERRFGPARFRAEFLSAWQRAASIGPRPSR